MIQGTIIVHDGKVFLLGIKEGQPVYYPMSVEDLIEYLEHTEKLWQDALAPSEKEAKKLTYHAENVTHVEQEDVTVGTSD